MKERLNIPQQKETGVQKGISIVGSGLEPPEIKKIYRRLKNEGKCCEGGSEGWSG